MKEDWWKVEEKNENSPTTPIKMKENVNPNINKKKRFTKRKKAYPSNCETSVKYNTNY